MRRSAVRRVGANRGFTLVEIMASIAVTATVLGAGVATYIGTIRSWEGTSSLAGIQREASLAMDVVTRQIREGSSVTINGAGDSLCIYYDTSSGDSLGAAYYLGERALCDMDGGVVVPNVSAVSFTSDDSRTVNIDITLLDDMGTPDVMSDDQTTLMSSTVACRN
jgi:prepilin-type N-terminal cleavage/methylation domain-containing protein